MAFQFDSSQQLIPPQANGLLVPDFEPIALTHVSFPLSGLLSLVAPSEDGVAVEVAWVGNEGMAGIGPGRNQ